MKESKRVWAVYFMEPGRLLAPRNLWVRAKDVAGAIKRASAIAHSRDDLRGWNVIEVKHVGDLDD